ncbi:MAG: alpha/beta hydrolase [Deltaproteobacteria bacterium]|nr:alpha/beta hydrolase [Deltaproteobacteria bacterium]
MPGWCTNRSVFRDLAELCSRRYRVLSLDWRGHGESGSSGDDFGNDELVEDALNVVRASGARAIVPVALSHAGWVAIGLHHRLGARVEKLVLLDWIIMMQPPREFFEALDGMQSPDRWRETVERIASVWLSNVENAALIRFVREEMGSYGFEMWSRAAREIAAAYAEKGTPLQRLEGLDPALPVLHLYAQPDDPGYLAAQRSFAAEHPWFKVERLKARSHFPMFEVPDEMAAHIEQFVGL